MDWAGDIAWIRLNRPGRGNALTPALLDALHAALDSAKTARAVVLTGTGRAFSSGGDIREFHARSADREALEAFGDSVVRALNRALLALRDLPCPSLAAINGPVTGGAIGLMLACDVSVISRSAFIQPYYAKMGFAPDGGWTALLPERIGAARTASWLVSDARVSAVAAFEMGLVDRLVEPEALADTVSGLAAELADHDGEVTATTRQLIAAQQGHDPLETRLARELDAFKRLLVRPETRARMAAFLGPKAEAR